MVRYIKLDRGSSLIKLDDSDLNKLALVESGGNIDWCWMVDEDGIFTYNNTTYNVKANDIIVTLYNNGNTRDVAIITSKEWSNSIIERNKQRVEENTKCGTICECASQSRG